MGHAPPTLVELRRFLAEQYDVPRNRFGIAGTITPRRPWGYHLGKKEIYGPEGMGDRDYSVRRTRDAQGLSNASAGFDINIGAAEERKLVAYLVELARTGKDGKMLAEIIGPDKDGTAKRWVKPKWGDPVTARQDHDWHIHLSFLRDTEEVDKRPLFFDLFGLGEKLNAANRGMLADPDEPANLMHPEPAIGAEPEPDESDEAEASEEGEGDALEGEG